MSRSLTHPGHQAVHHEGGGVWAALVVLAVLVLAVRGAWRLGVMAADRVDIRESLRDIPSALRNAPNPQPIPIPTQRRPAVEQRR